MIQIQDLQKSYGSKQALKGISCTIEAGEIVGLLGLNGAGKSTAMNILTGCLAATGGSVLIDGIDIAAEPLKAKQKIGYLPEIPPLYTDMQVLRYLEFIYELKKVRANKQEHLSKICERAGISHVKNRLIKNLSKGYRQRVGLAQALIGEPPILILDEPTVGLDPTQMIEIRSLIEELGRERTVILSSHILSEVRAVCGRIIVLHEGQIVADDTPEHLEASPLRGNSCVAAIEGDPDEVQQALLNAQGIEQVTLLAQTEPGVHEYRIQGSAGADIRRPLFYALAEAGLPLLGTRTDHRSLEDVFLKLVDAGQPGGDA